MRSSLRGSGDCCCRVLGGWKRSSMALWSSCRLQRPVRSLAAASYLTTAGSSRVRTGSAPVLPGTPVGLLLVKLSIRAPSKTNCGARESGRERVVGFGGRFNRVLRRDEHPSFEEAGQFAGLNSCAPDHGRVSNAGSGFASEICVGLPPVSGMKAATEFASTNSAGTGSNTQRATRVDGRTGRSIAGRPFQC